MVNSTEILCTPIEDMDIVDLKMARDDLRSALSNAEQEAATAIKHRLAEIRDRIKAIKTDGDNTFHPAGWVPPKSATSRTQTIVGWGASATTH